MGPTAAGKTDLAIELTKSFPCEIISVDSAMIYRTMDIGTAKPSKEILATIPHHLIDICDPAETYSVGQFCQDALTRISEIQQKNKMPILVGGTMLYFRALQQGLSVLPKADLHVRAEINQQALQHGWPALHQQLAIIDPPTAQRIHPNDAQRIQRALEVYQLTNIPLGKWHEQQQGFLQSYDVISIGLIPDDRNLLKQHIQRRFDTMLAQGFMDEVETLYQRSDLNSELPSLRAVGYRQAWQYLAGNIDKDQMRSQAIIATQQLAKRQLTWLRSWQNLQTFNSYDKDIIIYLCHFLQQQIAKYQKA